MTHADLINALFPDAPPADYKAHALIIPLATVQAMNDAQEAVGSTKHKVQPVATTDGRWLVSADILPEFQESGLFKRVILYLEPDIFAGIEVVPWQEGIALLPQPEDPDEI